MRDHPDPVEGGECDAQGCHHEDHVLGSFPGSSRQSASRQPVAEQHLRNLERFERERPGERFEERFSERFESTRKHKLLTRVSDVSKSCQVHMTPDQSQIRTRTE